MVFGVLGRYPLKYNAFLITSNSRLPTANQICTSLHFRHVIGHGSGLRLAACGRKSNRGKGRALSRRP
jgi:hypothetical protein